MSNLSSSFIFFKLPLIINYLIYHPHINIDIHIDSLPTNFFSLYHNFYHNYVLIFKRITLTELNTFIEPLDINNTDLYKSLVIYENKYISKINKNIISYNPFLVFNEKYSVNNDFKIIFLAYYTGLSEN